ncbi:MAG TPA: dihydrolipoyl dehydrogenase [Acidimicrobiales bacterium]|jgi:dihydrolipoamide dehydrogenase|nr:dihydrolipoyl dehydrogenase [Acidimicrobiales bacterium]
MATEEEFDIVVIGGGPGGYATALYGAAAGMSVAIVERDKVGGTCLHRGCIPAKAFLETAAVRRTVEGSKEFGIDVTGVALDFARSQERKQAVVDKLFKGLAGLLKGRKVTTLTGTGTLKEGRRVEVLDGPDAGRVLTGRNVVLAAGSVPQLLPGFEVDGRWVMTSDEFLDLDTVPASVVVIGGGVVGCEFASLLADLGSKVTILEALDGILPGCDEDIVRLVVRSFKKRGIDIVTGVKVESHTPSSDDTVTTVKGGDGSWDVETIVVSVGRRPRTEGLVADGVGVTIDERGFVVTDEYQRTGVDGVWAVGDIVAATPQLAHVGFAEAIVAVKGMLGEPVVPVDDGKVPWAIYCHPEVAFCGLTEAQAKAAGIEVLTKKDPFGGNSRAQIIGDTEGLVKIVAEKRPDGTAGTILGVHMCGPWVTEQLSGGYLAVNWEAFPDEVAQFIEPHPSLSETFGETMLALTGRGLHLG